ncbi:MAG: radical SAM protein [Syntrophomonas sp.]|nr:radical SAM protein [Syntrophomonas sp.]
MKKSFKHEIKHYNIPIFIPHLGCPYECIYCDQKKITAQQNAPDIGQVIHTIEDYLQTIPSGAEVDVAFFGGNFTAVDKKVQRDYLYAVQPYLQQGKVNCIRISTRPDCIDEPVLDMLAYYGVRMIELGVQSLDERVLLASSRNYKPEDVLKSSRLIKEKGFELGIQLMIGLPRDSYDSDIETARKTIAMRPQEVRIYPTLVIADTALDSMWKRGDYNPLSLEEAICTCAEMFLMMQKENIRVIRMGLYAGEELRRDGVVQAGPFHPSFGELVEQEIFKQQALFALRRFNQLFGYHPEINLHVNSRDISKMVGNKQKNLRLLKQELDVVKLKADPTGERNWVGISAGGADKAQLIISRADYIIMRDS